MGLRNRDLWRPGVGAGGLSRNDGRGGSPAAMSGRTPERLAANAIPAGAENVEDAGASRTLRPHAERRDENEGAERRDEQDLRRILAESGIVTRSLGGGPKSAPDGVQYSPFGRGSQAETRRLSPQRRGGRGEQEQEALGRRQ
jgi:hypothetical protein